MSSSCPTSHRVTGIRTYPPQPAQTSTSSSTSRPRTRVTCRSPPTIPLQPTLRGSCHHQGTRQMNRWAARLRGPPRRRELVPAGFRPRRSTHSLPSTSESRLHRSGPLGPVGKAEQFEVASGIAVVPELLLEHRVDAVLHGVRTVLEDVDGGRKVVDGDR